MNIINNKNLVIIVLLVLIITSASCSRKNRKSSTVQIIYIANDGFLIKIEDKKILIDALFGKEELDFCATPGKKNINQIIHSKEDFESIDLVVATHYHHDHFHAPYVSKFLLNNKQVKFISTDQSCDDLKEEPDYSKIKRQIIGNTPDPLSSISKKARGIEIEMFRLRHSPYYEKDPESGEKYDRHSKVQNLGVIFNVNGVKIFHSGDSSPKWINEYRKFSFYKKDIDIAFLDRAFISQPYGADIIKTYIKPKKIIPMHIHPDNITRFSEIVDNSGNKFPPIIIFENKMDKNSIKIGQ